LHDIFEEVLAGGAIKDLKKVNQKCRLMNISSEIYYRTFQGEVFTAGNHSIRVTSYSTETNVFTWKFQRHLSTLFLPPNTRSVNNYLNHHGRTRLGGLIRPVWLWHHFHAVFRWRGSNPRPFDLEPSLRPTRPQLWTLTSHSIPHFNFSVKVLLRYFF